MDPTPSIPYLTFDSIFYYLNSGSHILGSRSHSLDPGSHSMDSESCPWIFSHISWIPNSTPLIPDPTPWVSFLLPRLQIHSWNSTYHYQDPRLDRTPRISIFTPGIRDSQSSEKTDSNVNQYSGIYAYINILANRDIFEESVAGQSSLWSLRSRRQCSTKDSKDSLNDSSFTMKDIDNESTWCGQQMMDMVGVDGGIFGPQSATGKCIRGYICLHDRCMQVLRQMST